MLDALAPYKLPILASALTHRVIYAESVGTGRTVFDIDPSGAASAEVTALAAEILETAANGKETADRSAP